MYQPAPLKKGKTMRKHSAVTTGYMVEVMDGSILSEIVHLPSFCSLLDWFDNEAKDVSMMEPTNRRELANAIAKGSDFFELGISTREWTVCVGKNELGGVTFAVTKLDPLY